MTAGEKQVHIMAVLAHGFVAGGIGILT